MASLSPSTPENVSRYTNHHLGLRRVNTLPSKLHSTPPRSSPSAGPSPDSVETLFVHAGTKVVSFTVQSTSSTRPGSSAGRRYGQDATSGTLAWDSPSERTMAAGMLDVLEHTSCSPLTQLCRTSESLSRAQFRSLISQFRIPITSHPTEVTMLVRRRQVNICSTRKRGQFLSHRAPI